MEELRRFDTECWICETCGVQVAPSANPPAECHICIDHRQFIPKVGQRWAKQELLKQRGYRNMYQKQESNLYGIATTPKFGIGQRAFLLRTPHGNLLCDCVTFLDDATIDIINGLGGIRAIAISHPHFYGANAQWSAAFGNIPVYMHEKDKQWAGFDHENVTYWSGESFHLWDDISLVLIGGHFPGGSIVHWPSGADGKGVIISGDLLQVGLDRKSISIMRSFPNYIPLSTFHAVRISNIMDGLEYDRLYGAFFDLEINTQAKAIVKNSLVRYVKWLQSCNLDA